MPSDAPGTQATPVTVSLQYKQKSSRSLSLATRIAVVTVGCVILAVLIAGAVSYPLARDASRQQSVENLEQLADATAAAIERQPQNGNDLVPARLLTVLRTEDISAFYFPAGRRLPDVLTRSDIRSLAEGDGIHGSRQSDGEDVIFSARPLTSGAVVLLTQPVTVSSRLTTQALARFGIALAIGVAIAAVAGLVLARRLTRPLRNAAKAAEQLSQGDRDVVLAVQGPREIGELAEALNELRNALAISEGRQRDFLLSVSHELRTPLTAIRGYAEAISDGVVGPDDIERTGATMQIEADRLDQLVADLLYLARLDAVDVRIAPVDVDLAAVGLQAAQVWHDRCEAEGLPFYAELPQTPLMAHTDALRVRQIIDNLAANALRVTPAGQPIILAVRPLGPDAVEVEVRDGGPGLTPDDCLVAFEPAELYSRYHGIRKVGTGVGLALVGRLAARLGGSASAGSAPEGGARFTIRIARTLQN